jgi:hypothetical protein
VTEIADAAYPVGFLKTDGESFTGVAEADHHLEALEIACAAATKGQRGSCSTGALVELRPD